MRVLMNCRWMNCNPSMNPPWIKRPDTSPSTSVDHCFYKNKYLVRCIQ